MSETDFDKVRQHLSEALRELKKGEHDQLGSPWNPLTVEEAIESLIETVTEIDVSWRTPEI